MKQCDNGHFYDENRFETCPYCQEGAGVGKTVAAGSVGKTVAAIPRGPAPEVDRGKTVGIIQKKIGNRPCGGLPGMHCRAPSGRGLQAGGGPELHRPGGGHGTCPWRTTTPCPGKATPW